MSDLKSYSVEEFLASLITDSIKEVNSPSYPDADYNIRAPLLVESEDNEDDVTNYSLTLKLLKRKGKVEQIYYDTFELSDNEFIDFNLELRGSDNINTFNIEKED